MAFVMDRFGGAVTRVHLSVVSLLHYLSFLSHWRAFILVFFHAACYSVLGAGISIATSNLIFLTCVDPGRRASAFGLASCLGSLSILSSPPLAGFLADQLESYAPSFYLAAVRYSFVLSFHFYSSVLKRTETMKVIRR
ncbi:hypothetical protein OS493_017557 [Desmophyllum pertusum]|uniref:Monocarboxylate transporter n=1 Tax=Desmophyllum pertusum TaxID=174260 RepID=A0A9W9ZPQ5_9CNID|nr:hypothetical protein OS493_017557 [Desmophyllum pertusum]